MESGARVPVRIERQQPGTASTARTREHLDDSFARALWGEAVLLDETCYPEARALLDERLADSRADDGDVLGRVNAGAHDRCVADTTG